MKRWLAALIVSGLLVFTVGNALRAITRVGGEPVPEWPTCVAIGL